ncbi:leucine-rich repeat protein, putative [Bodo saltans]|uniref:Leucine-rich repeat protein, putative n=1 Tax=Bodo saltans TaxID=75058 RepID=A0A0S4IR36_BODSA|nr:leucine-rich repeat protein, putative [Bodo saltans]|eukprot:CUE72887.1 leucine-rich repeat protein, putative [Bodo saltans]
MKKMATLLANDNLLRLRRRRCTLQRCLELVLGQSDHDVTDVTWELIARIKCCQRLDFMKATRYCTSEAGVIHITTMQHLTQLRLNCTQLTDVGCEYIGQGLPQLTGLRLRRCSITGAGVAALPHCVRGLTSLDFAMCREVDDAACSLHIARCLHDLVELREYIVLHVHHGCWCSVDTKVSA